MKTINSEVLGELARAWRGEAEQGKDTAYPEGDAGKIMMAKDSERAATLCDCADRLEDVVTLLSVYES